MFGLQSGKKQISAILKLLSFFWSVLIFLAISSFFDLKLPPPFGQLPDYAFTLVMFLFQPIYFISFMIIMVVGSYYHLKKLMGWDELVAMYKISPPKELPANLISGTLNDVHFSNLFKISISDEGLFLHSFSLLNFLLKPLFIPWSHVSVKEETGHKRILKLLPYGFNYKYFEVQSIYDNVLKLQIYNSSLSMRNIELLSRIAK